MTCSIDKTRFLVLNKLSDWERGLSLHLEADDEGLRLPTISRIEPQVSADGLSPSIRVQDMGAGGCSRLYILDRHAKQIWIYYAEHDQAELLRCIGHDLSEPWSLASSGQSLFLACGEGEDRLLAYAHHDWQIRWAVSRQRDAAGRLLPVRDFTPFALATSRSGNLIALAPLYPVKDKTSAAAFQLAVLEFDPQGHLIRFSRPTGLKLSGKVTFLDLSANAFLATSDDDTLYILDSTANQLHLLAPTPDRKSRKLESKSPQAEALKKLEIEASGLAVDTRGTLFVGDSRKVPPDQEDPRLIWAYNPQSSRFESVPGYRGGSRILTAGSSGRIYIFDPHRRRVFVLQQALEQPTRVVPPFSGRFYSASLDSRADGTRWHRILADMQLPDQANNQIRIAYRASDQPTLEGSSDVLDELLANRPTDQATLTRIEELEWIEIPANPHDALIQDAEGRAAQGRYLWLRIDLQGSQFETPALHALQIEFPRDTYLRYLPSVYQQDVQGRDFLERFLSLFESFMGGLELHIDQVARYFDYEAVSGGFLRWLASWLAIAAREEWSEDQLRDLIRRSPELHRRRGTRQGLQEILEVLTEECPILMEWCQWDCPTSPQGKSDFSKVYGGDPYTFWVLLPTFRLCRLRGDDRLWDPQRLIREAACLPAEDLLEEWAPARMERVRRLIEAEKPAHSAARVVALREQLLLDQHTFLGFNSRLGESFPRLGTGMVFGRDTLLEGGPLEPGQVERRSRVEVDTSLT